MLKFVIAALFLTTIAAQQVTVTRSESDNNADGTFSWASELSDGSRIEQNGFIRDGPDPENPIQVIQGSYSYTSPEGQLITVNYVADENGFQPIGDHLPALPKTGQQSAAAPQRPAPKRPANNRRF